MKNLSKKKKFFLVALVIVAFLLFEFWPLIFPKKQIAGGGALWDEQTKQYYSPEEAEAIKAERAKHNQ